MLGSTAFWRIFYVQQRPNRHLDSRCTNGVTIGVTGLGKNELPRMAINKLTHPVLRAAKPHEKSYKLGDGGGLYLLVNPNGALWWRLKYQFEGREKLL